MEQREIKFRVWDPKKKKLELINGYGSADDGVFTLDTGDKNQVWMQYTGLKDKNGKEIYEGDIVRAESGSGSDRNGSYITYSGGVISIQFDGIYFGDLSYWANGHILSWTKNLEIIGNIYSNPELLTKELLSVHN